MYVLHIYPYQHMCTPGAPRGGTVISRVYKVERLFICMWGRGMGRIFNLIHAWIFLLPPNRTWQADVLEMQYTRLPIFNAPA